MPPLQPCSSWHWPIGNHSSLNLVLKNESDAILILQKLVDLNPSFGRASSANCILSLTSLSIHGTTTLLRMWSQRVEDVISKRLSFIHALGLYLRDGWYLGYFGRDSQRTSRRSVPGFVALFSKGLRIIQTSDSLKSQVFYVLPWVLSCSQ